MSLPVAVPMPASRPVRRLRLRLRAACLAALCVLAGAPAGAAPPTPPEVAAEQVLTETNSNATVGAFQRVAQVFALHAPGEFSHVMLPVACDPQATLRVAIEPAPSGVPNGRAVVLQDVPGHALDALQYGSVVSSMRMVELPQGVLAKAGTYAITLDTRRTGDCGLWRAPPGTPYAWFAYTSAPGGAWQPLRDAVGRPQALAFQVFYRPR